MLAPHYEGLFWCMSHECCYKRLHCMDVPNTLSSSSIVCQALGKKFEEAKLLGFLSVVTNHARMFHLLFHLLFHPFRTIGYHKGITKH